MRSWWQNIREDGGLRLTYEGFYVFENLLELSSYTFDLPEKLLTPKQLAGHGPTHDLSLLHGQQSQTQQHSDVWQSRSHDGSIAWRHAEIY
jgi:hypothetical protein